MPGFNAVNPLCDNANSLYGDTHAHTHTHTHTNNQHLKVSDANLTGWKSITCLAHLIDIYHSMKITPKAIHLRWTVLFKAHLYSGRAWEFLIEHAMSSRALWCKWVPFVEGAKQTHLWNRLGVGGGFTLLIPTKDLQCQNTARFCWHLRKKTDRNE